MVNDMDKMQVRLNLKNEAKKRMKKLNFGDTVTNVCAGLGNPRRNAYFVSSVTKSHADRKFGIIHKDYYVKCTDRKGKFWQTDIEVVYPGHLSPEECKKIYAPIHTAHF